MTYLNALELEREPFSNSPDPDLFFPAQQHAGCLKKIEVSVRLRRGISVVIGDVGTGKSTICRQLVRLLSRDELLETHLILDPAFECATEMLKGLVKAFGLSPDSGPEDEWHLKESIKNHLFKRVLGDGKTVVLVIDEGQKMPGFGLEVLREFLNYETNEHKLLQIVLFGQEELLGTLEKTHRNLLDRVDVLCSLGHLNLRETRDMIRFRVAQAARDAVKPPELFTISALRAVYRATGGYPRKIVNLCHRVVLQMLARKERRATWCMVRATMRGDGKLPARGGLMKWAGLLVAVGLLGVMVVVQFFPHLLSRKPLSAGAPIEGAMVSRGPVGTPVEQVSVAAPVLTPPAVEGMAPVLVTDANVSSPVEEAGGAGAADEPQERAAPPMVLPPATGPVRIGEVRAWRHDQFFRLVVQFSGEPRLGVPELAGGEVQVRVDGDVSSLKPGWLYRHHGFTLRSDPRQGGVDLRFDFPEGVDRLKWFVMKAPERLVMDFYNGEGTGPGMLVMLRAPGN